MLMVPPLAATVGLAFTVPSVVMFRAPGLVNVTVPARPPAARELIVPPLDSDRVLSVVTPPTEATVPAAVTTVLEPAELAVRITLPAVELIDWAVSTVAAACGLIVTLVPFAVIAPASVPAPTTLTACPALLNVRVPNVPDPVLAVILPVSVTFREAAAELLIETDPPLPAAGPLALMLPVIPLLATAAPTTKGLTASLYVMPTAPPPPVPFPLALIEPVYCKFPAAAVPAERVKLPPLPLVPKGPAVIDPEFSTRFLAAVMVMLPPLPAADPPEPPLAETTKFPAAAPTAISPVAPVVNMVTVPPLPVPLALALTVRPPAPVTIIVGAWILTMPPELAPAPEPFALSVPF